MGRIDWTGTFPLHFGYISILRSIPWHSYLPANADYRVVFSIESLEPGVFMFVSPAVCTVLGTFSKWLLNERMNEWMSEFEKLSWISDNM